MVALVVAGAGIGTSFIAFGRSNLKPLPAVPVGHGYVIRFPDGPLGYEKKGLAILDAATQYEQVQILSGRERVRGDGARLAAELVRVVVVGGAGAIVTALLGFLGFG